jgi:excisionase family DNA binding protein
MKIMPESAEFLNKNLPLEADFYSWYKVAMRMLTTNEAAERLGLSVRRVNDFIQDGRLPAQKFGRAHMISERDVDKIAKVERRRGRPRKKEK